MTAYWKWRFSFVYEGVINPYSSWLLLNSFSSPFFSLFHRSCSLSCSSSSSPGYTNSVGEYLLFVCLRLFLVAPSFPVSLPPSFPTPPLPFSTLFRELQWLKHTFNHPGSRQLFAERQGACGLSWWRFATTVGAFDVPLRAPEHDSGQLPVPLRLTVHPCHLWRPERHWGGKTLVVKHPGECKGVESVVLYKHPSRPTAPD